MLKELRVRNFKSIADSTLPLSVINVLVGENGSGKSSFVQTLALLKQSLGNNGLRLSSALLDLGTFPDVLHRPVVSEEIELSLEGTVVAPEAYMRGLRVESSAGFGDTWRVNAQTLTRLVSRRTFAAGEVAAEWTPVTGVKMSQSQVVIGGSTVSSSPNTFAQSIGGGPQPSSYTQPADMDPTTYQRLINLILYFFSAPSQALGRFFLVPAVRGIERQSYDLGDQAMLDLGSPEGSLRVGQSLATTILYRRELELTISSWMNRITGRGIQGRALPPRKVSLDAVAHGQAINIVNEGFGSNQLAHVLTQLAILPSDSFLAIEEPEIHLHPAAQTKLVGVLVETILAGGNQLIVTTHSEHILYALMALVAEGTLQPEQVVIHNVANIEGTSALERLRLDKGGRITGGIPGFFDAQVQEFRRFLEAAEKPSS